MTDRATMKAVTFQGYGPPETLAIRDVPLPMPGVGEVRVQVHASTVTRTDTATMRGHPFFARAATGFCRPKMPTPGIDFAGIIDALGAGVTGFAPGDRVFGLSPDSYGTHAEHLCLRADAAIAPVPAGLRFDQAVVGEGAWYAHGTTSQLDPGQRCLIYGASGGIGTAAVQLAKLRGAEVTAVVGAQHLDLAAQLGADRVVNYEAEDFTALGQTFDLVFDAVGKTSWFACRPLLTPDAIFAATDLGPGWSNVLLGAWFARSARPRVQIPFPKDASGFVRSLGGLLAEGRFRGVFDRRYPFDDVVEAFRYVETGQKTGIVGLTVRPEEATGGDGAG
jgi:NADPH:quinone reductase-like Zn-dependent oxidoreductase